MAPKPTPSLLRQVRAATMKISITLEVPRGDWTAERWYHCWENEECNWIYGTPQEAFDHMNRKHAGEPIFWNINPLP